MIDEHIERIKCLGKSIDSYKAERELLEKQLEDELCVTYPEYRVMKYVLRKLQEKRQTYVMYYGRLNEGISQGYELAISDVSRMLSDFKATIK